MRKRRTRWLDVSFFRPWGGCVDIYEADKIGLWVLLEAMIGDYDGDGSLTIEPLRFGR